MNTVLDEQIDRRRTIDHDQIVRVGHAQGSAPIQHHHFAPLDKAAHRLVNAHHLPRRDGDIWSAMPALGDDRFDVLVDLIKLLAERIGDHA